MSKQRNTMKAIDAAVAAILKLPQSEHNEWLCYIVEAVEEDCGSAALETLRVSIAERYDDHEW